MSDSKQPLTDMPPTMVYVTAPSNLPGAYTFDANINGDPNQTFTVEVPPEGVSEGQLFLAPIPEDSMPVKRVNVPTGAWKDGIFHCCAQGPFHASLWCAICCPQILMGQVMARMDLTWLGEGGAPISTKPAFQVVCVIVAAYLVYSTALELASMPYTVDTMPPFLPALKATGSVLFSLWSFYSLCRTRYNARAKYSIPEQHCRGCEDLCCSLFCTCCTVHQLARHTGEYEAYTGTCCTETGHPRGSPMVV